ncbi:MAG: AAA family ATPase, partial [Phycisphaerae bacterium]
MIKRLEVERYRSFEHLELEMRPLTVLIGPNGGGKSNLLDIFSFLSQAAFGELADAIARRGGFDSLRFRGSPEERIFFGVDFSSEEPFADEGCDVHYKLQLRPIGSVGSVWFEQVSLGPKPGYDKPMTLMHRDKESCKFRNLLAKEMDEIKELESETELAITQVKDQKAYPTPYKLMRTMASWGPYAPTYTGLDAPIRRPQLLRPGLRVAKDGGNLASVLHGLQSQLPHAYAELEDRLRTAYPGLKYLSFPQEGGDGMINLRWWEEPYEEEFGFSASLL